MTHKHEYNPLNGRCDCGKRHCRCGDRTYHKPNCATIKAARVHALKVHDPYTGAWAGLSASITDSWIEARYA